MRVKAGKVGVDKTRVACELPFSDLILQSRELEVRRRKAAPNPHEALCHPENAWQTK
jgi:hypothetical protein